MLYARSTTTTPNKPYVGPLMPAWVPVPEARKIETPWHRMLREAVLDAVTTVLRSSDVEDVGEDIWWLWHDPGTQSAWGFEWCCEHLGVDAGAVRRELQRALEAAGKWMPREWAICFAACAWGRRQASRTVVHFLWQANGSGYRLRPAFVKGRLQFASTPPDQGRQTRHVARSCVNAAW